MLESVSDTFEDLDGNDGLSFDITSPERKEILRIRHTGGEWAVDVSEHMLYIFDNHIHLGNSFTLLRLID